MLNILAASNLISPNSSTLVSPGQSSASFLSTFMAAMAGMWIVMLIVAIVTIIGMWKVFEKAGKPGWRSIIPFLNMYDLMEIAGYNGWYFLIAFIPLVGPLVAAIMSAMGVSKKFGQGTLFTVLLVLISPIMYCVLGFGNYAYEGAGAKKSGGPAPKASSDPWVDGKA